MREGEIEDIMQKVLVWMCVKIQVLVRTLFHSQREPLSVSGDGSDTQESALGPFTPSAMGTEVD